MQLRDISLALLVSAAWGFNFIAVKYAVQDFSPYMANSLRFGIVLLVLSPFLRIVPGKMVALLMAALVLGVAHFNLILFAVQVADGVGAVSIAIQLGVPFSTILAILVLKETVGWKRVMGILLSFAGVMVLGFDPVIFSYWHALLLGALAALMYAVSSVLMRKLKDVPAVTTQAWVAAAAAAGSLALSLCLETDHGDTLINAGSDAWWAIGYSVIAASLIGHGGANHLFRKHDVSAVSPYFLSVPLFAVFGGIIMLDEKVSAEIIIGGVLTIAGVLIVTLRNKATHSKMADVKYTEG